METLGSNHDFDFGKFFHWIDHNPWVAIPLIFYLSTVYLAVKRDKSFWQVWFNGATPQFMMGKKFRDRTKLCQKRNEPCDGSCGDECQNKKRD